MRAVVVLRVKRTSEVPPRFAHVEPRLELAEFDMAPCQCGARFAEHDWVLTFRDDIAVLACSREERGAGHGDVQGYAEAMADGEFLFAGDEMLKPPAGGLVSGQHRLHRLVDSDDHERPGDEESALDD